MSDETVTSFREGHAACPFVAFEDDRDHRADHPDYRHRCFAAADAAGEPRALPHQERFCLSAAFAQCPIFLDWARQEAAGIVDKNATAAAADEAAVAAARVTVGAAPAFLASRGRTTPAEATPANAHSSDPGSGLWGFEGAPKRAITPVAAPARVPTTPPVVAMAARREPTRPAWENPPRMDNYPRLRAREDRSNNQPLLLAAMGVAAVMIAVIAYSVWGGGGSGGGTGGNGSNPSASHIAGASGSGVVAAVTDTPLPTPNATPTMLHYRIKSGEALQTIANRYGITLDLLLAANPTIKNPNYVQVNQWIWIPSPDWIPPTPAPTPTPAPSPTPLPTPTPKITPAPTY